MITHIKRFFLGDKRDPQAPGIFHKITLLAFLAWVGLGSDGLSSSCYGPAEVLQSLGKHSHLGILVGLASVITIFIISSSYSQIIELFPSGGGGYLVASNLLSPTIGMISGCALIIDYVLTIAVSIASGADAILSFLPLWFKNYKVEIAVVVLIFLTIINLRGVKESVTPLVPIFLLFLISHIFVIFYSIISHSSEVTAVSQRIASDISGTYSTLGLFGFVYLLAHAYSMGAGTYTGIEAVSNGLPILREPRVQTAKKTMMYMAISLSVMVIGLLIAYDFQDVREVAGKTINAVLIEKATTNWNPTISLIFTITTLLTESAILFVAAQTGFMDGPRILSNMALDRWLPTRFATLSDRLTTQNGILMMSVLAIVIIALTQGSVTFLVVLYSINVFITFVLSQLGMVRHWLKVRKSNPLWIGKILINGVGLVLTTFILITITIVKFHEGGWITIVITTGLILVVLKIKKEYSITKKLLKKFDILIPTMEQEIKKYSHRYKDINTSYRSKTAVLLVNGYSGVGIHSILAIIRQFGNMFKNFVFLEIGIINAGLFKGDEDIIKLKENLKLDIQQYIDLVKKMGYHGDGFFSLGLEVVQEVEKMSDEISKKYPESMYFGGQLVFPKDTLLTRILHNHIVFAIQRRFFRTGREFIILPLKLR